LQDICDKLFALARPYLAVRENQKHTEICYSYALKLLEHIGGRPEIVLPAIILHDVGWSAVPPEKHLLAFGPGEIDKELRRVHEVEGVKIAERLLQEVPLSKEDIREICRIIKNHDSGENPLSLEEKMVKDADKLFRFSQEAFTLDVERFSMKPRENWERLYASLDEWFFTDFAKELAIRELQNLEKLASR
jgi:HD superfamily phosphodiesterase